MCCDCIFLVCIVLNQTLIIITVFADSKIMQRLVLDCRVTILVCISRCAVRFSQSSCAILINNRLPCLLRFDIALKRIGLRNFIGALLNVCEVYHTFIVGYGIDQNICTVHRSAGQFELCIMHTHAGHKICLTECQITVGTRSVFNIENAVFIRCFPIKRDSSITSDYYVMQCVVFQIIRNAFYFLQCVVSFFNIIKINTSGFAGLQNTVCFCAILRCSFQLECDAFNGCIIIFAADFFNFQTAFDTQIHFNMILMNQICCTSASVFVHCCVVQIDIIVRSRISRRSIIRRWSLHIDHACDCAVWIEDKVGAVCLFAQINGNCLHL